MQNPGYEGSMGRRRTRSSASSYTVLPCPVTGRTFLILHSARHRPGRTVLVRMFRSLLAVVCLLIVCASALEAQAVRGVVRHAQTGRPVGGTYIVLLDADSLEITRSITNALGAFLIPAPRAGTYRLRTERIGYRSVVSATLELAEATVVEVELPVEPVVVQLEALFVEGTRECRVVGEQALEVLDLWEEARKALQAVAWADVQEYLVHELERFERWYTPGFRLLDERRATTPTRHVMPFRSRSVEELEEHGYVIVDEDSVVYEAPDAEVFFSVPFLQHHCFWIDEDNQDGQQKVGLRFEPVDGRSLPDVSGVFWIDAETIALERLELGYVNVGLWQRERGAAAEVEFDRLPDGRWFVSRWWIRMPMVQRVETLKGPVWDLEEAIVGFEEEGGVVRRVFAADGRAMYARDRATVRGFVYDSISGAGMADAYVSLVGTDHTTISQADGSYWLTDLPEGRYAVTFSHPNATLLGVEYETEVELEVGTNAHADLFMPSPETVVDRLCTETESGVELGLLAGGVRDATRASPVSGAHVRIVYSIAAGDEGEEIVRWLDTRTDLDGLFRTCVPRNAPMSVEVSVIGAAHAALPVMFGGSLIQIVEIDLQLAEPEIPGN